VAAIIRDRLDMSYTELARVLGYRDHTSVMNGVRRARINRMQNDYWAADFSAIENAMLPWREEAEIEKLEIGA
jgi:chromosomal replication initiation ATPase DnaA